MKNKESQKSSEKSETPKKRYKAIISSVITVCVLILCCLIATEVIRASNEHRPPRILGYSISYVPTDSMEPTIEAGDYILFRQISFDEVQSGDVIIYRSKSGTIAGSFIVHRVVEKNSTYLITQGDHNVLADTEPVTADMVYGKYICTLSAMSIFGSSSRPIVFGILVTAFALLLILQFVSTWIQFRKNKIAQEHRSLTEREIEELKKEILEEELKKIKESQSKK